MAIWVARTRRQIRIGGAEESCRRLRMPSREQRLHHPRRVVGHLRKTLDAKLGGSSEESLLWLPAEWCRSYSLPKLPKIVSQFGQHVAKGRYEFTAYHVPCHEVTLKDVSYHHLRFQALKRMASTLPSGHSQVVPDLTESLGYVFRRPNSTKRTFSRRAQGIPSSHLSNYHWAFPHCSRWLF
jgi:hypothetical protein